MFKITAIDSAFTPTKVVDYFGFPILVPTWASYVTVDKLGIIGAFSHRPVESLSGFTKASHSDLYRMVGKARFSGDWKDSLLKVSDDN